MKYFRLFLALQLAVFSAFGNYNYAQEFIEDFPSLNQNGEDIEIIEEGFEEMIEEFASVDDEIEENIKTDNYEGNEFIQENLTDFGEKIDELESIKNEDKVTYLDKVEILDSEIESISGEYELLEDKDIDFQDFSVIHSLDLGLKTSLIQTFGLLDNDSENELPNLIITEVFRGNANEWIEISNIGNRDFEGKLVFSGSSKAQTIPNKKVKIGAYSSIIIHDTNDMGLVEGLTYTGITFNMTGNINLDLVYSGKIIDSFISDITPDNIKNTSIQRIYNNGNRQIQSTTSKDICNISGFLANPGTFRIEGNQTPRIGDGPNFYAFCSNLDEIEGDDVLSGNDNYKLIISEVFYDGYDEWIEIFNIGEGSFYGDITLSGNIFGEGITSQIYTDIQIPSSGYVVFADNGVVFSDLEIKPIYNEGKYLNFEISENQSLNLNLLVDNNIADVFQVNSYWLERYAESSVSMEKYVIPSGYVISRSNYFDGGWGKSFNPGKLTIFKTAPEEEIKDYFYDKKGNSTLGDQEKDENEEFKLDCSSVYSDIITVSEIFRGSKDYDPYIEFDIHDDIQYEYDGLYLSGSLLDQPILLNLNEENETYDQELLQKNTKLILTTKPGNLGDAGLITISYHDDLKFNKYNGELELYGIDGQSRQLLDIIKITTGADEKSTYYGHLKRRCGDEFDTIADFSPDFNLSDLKYFSVKSTFTERVVETVKYVGGGGGCSCPSKAELCGNITLTGNTQTGENISNFVQTGNNLTGDMIDKKENNSDLSQEIKDNKDIKNSIKIVSLEYKTPESITLQSFLPYDVDFSKHTYYLKTSTATTKKYIDGILSSNSIDTFSKSFGFVDGGACVYLYSGDVILDTYCYYSEKVEKTEKEDKQKNTELFNPTDYQISITHIDYDPEGSDTGRESITLQSNSSKSLDLSKVKMKVNTTNKKLTGILNPNSLITLTGTFGFPNSTKDGSNVIVTIFTGDYILASYSYNPNKPKVEIPQGAVKVYSVIDGDTFRYRKEDGTLQSVRLLGVDAPESNTARYRTTECFGKESKNYLTNLIKNQYVILENDPNSDSTDSYGRMLAYVYLNGELVNQKLIEEGYAKEYTYKTDYLKQSEFLKAQQLAEKSEKGLRSSATCGISIAEEPQARGIDYEKLKIKIQSVIYDPDGADNGNEEIKLNVDISQTSGLNYLDLTDNFSLSISPRSEYSTGITKTKKLDTFGRYDLEFETTELSLKGNFQLPNNRATCVSIMQGSYIFDTFCYNPNKSSLEEKDEIIENLQIPDVKIQSILPNPSGADSGKEEIVLLRTPTEDYPSVLEILELDQDFTLLINNKTKKKLVGNLLPNQKITIKGSYSLPNSTSCVGLIYQGNKIDEFCYGKAGDGVKFNSDNTSVHEIPSEELAIVKKIRLIKQGDKLCTSYNNTIFNCKSIPNSTTEKNKKLLSMQNTYITQIQNYLKTEYSLLYYNSDLKEYFDLYTNAKKSIKSGNYTIETNGITIAATDISSLFPNTYHQEAKNYLLGQISEILPNKISSTLNQFKDKYYHSLAKNSKLDFITLI